MSAKRYRSIQGSTDLAFAARGSIAAGAALFAALCPSAAQAQDFAYCDMSVVQQTLKLQKNIDATVVSSGERKKQGIRLTEDKTNQRSSAFHEISVPFAPGTSFFQHFRVRIAGGLGNAPPNGADGFAFVIQNDPGGDPLLVGKLGSGATSLGAPGPGFGYSGITQSIALELDTLLNAAGSDPDGNHIALDIGGLTNHTSDGTAMAKALASMPAGSTVEPWQPIALDPGMNSLESSAAGNDTRDVWIDYVCAAAGGCSMKVYMTFNNATLPADFADPTKPATLPKKPDLPIMVVNNLKDMAEYLGGQAGFAGFTASTGMNADEHLVTFWVLSRSPLSDFNGNNLEDACECKAKPTACSGSVPICDLSTGLGFCRDCLNDGECAAVNPMTAICDLVATGGKGACVECLNDMHCPAERPFCDPSVQACTANCTNDAKCDTTEWCDNPTAAPFGGKCQADVANGSPMPSSAKHMPELNGMCTEAAAAAVCASGVCDTKDNLCGYPLGGPCTDEDGPIKCRSGACSDASVCACANDPDCGAANSGRVCQKTSGSCIEGCRGVDGHGCPPGLVCSSTTIDIGFCKPPPAVIQGPTLKDGSVEGAGFINCGVAGNGGSGGPAMLGLFAALSGWFARRSRGRRPAAGASPKAR